MEETLFADPQAAVPRDHCPVCGGERYDPGRSCLRCERRSMSLEEISRDYAEAARVLQGRLRQLRAMARGARDPEDAWHLKRRIAELTPILTQMNELADLTAHYYDRGYYRSEKYTV